ncbi:hypothetical protein FOL47_001600 [Perkinsus chesapeaki]|uniref:Uncharacterized protein n=1 Tax=Perkinsus chesapeaki TaxID=330153 RepID=A0A7J6MIJ7_PERCH|nr:hypothetical protein FOL47_001600 [Perkinsus chesapeaki]
MLRFTRARLYASAEFKLQLPRSAHTVYLALLSGQFGATLSTLVCRVPICKPTQGDRGYRLGGGQSQGRTAITVIHPVSEHHIALHGEKYPVTLCEMRPITHIPDQLKLHAVATGHPLFGDYYYTNDRVLDAHYESGKLYTMPRGLEGPAIQPWLSAPGVWHEEHIKSLKPRPVGDESSGPRIVRWPSRATPLLSEADEVPEILEEIVMEDQLSSLVGTSPMMPYESALRELVDIEPLVREWGFNEEDDVEIGQVKDPRYSDRDVFFDQPRKWVRKL